MDKKIFDDFPKVDCNDCSFYWRDQCDGVDIPLQGSNFTCKSFSPVRGITIPKEIKSLQKSIFWLRVAVIVLSLAVSLLAFVTFSQ